MSDLFVLDGYGLIYRSYYGFSGRQISNSKGENIAAILAFYNSIFAFFREKNPAQFVVALDSKTKTFRYDIYEDYKANRQQAPEDLHLQADIIEEILIALGIKTLRYTGYEADDVIATICKERCAKQLKTFIISSDKDLMQLIDDQVFMLRPDSKGGFNLYDSAKVYAEKKIRPQQMSDYLAIIGDSSDNIPGVKGLGPKAAEKLFAQFTSLDEIYENLSTITPPSVQKKLTEFKAEAYLSKALTLLEDSINLDLDICAPIFAIEKLNYLAAAEIFSSHGLAKLASSCLKMAGSPEPTSTPAVKQPKTLMATEVKENPLLFEMPKVFATFDSSPHLHYELIDTPAKLDSWLLEAQQAFVIAFDSETTGLDSNTALPVGFSFCFKADHAVYIPIKSLEPCLDEDYVKARLKSFLEQEQLKIVGQNLKYDYKILKRWGITIKPYFDTMIAAWLLESDSFFNMDFLAEKYLAYQTIHFSDVVPKNGAFAEVPLAQATNYAAEDADVTFKLYQKLEPLLKEKNLLAVMNDLEIPLMTILADMELTGIMLDTEALGALGSYIEYELKVIEKKIIDIAGHAFNLQSPKQLAEVLFDELKLPEIKKRSTDVAVLEALAAHGSEVAKLMLSYRSLNKLQTTYINTLITMVDENSRLHTDFLQTGTATGRLSSKSPNLQNIPVKEELGRKIRSAFVSKSGYSLISADYSQIELVALAHLAQDETMLRVFAEGHDLHRETAAFIYQIPQAEVSSLQRSVAKSINFGVIYGMSAFRLSNELKISRANAQNYIDAYFTKYAKVKLFMQKTIGLALEEGGVYTILNHFRPLPQLFSRNANDRASGERMAINTVVQGSAADIVKLAMIDFSWALKTQNLAAKILLQVHDEIIVEVPDDELLATKTLLEQIMEQAPQKLPIPMTIKVGLEHGKNWGLFH